MLIDIWLDYMCPFCFIGERRFMEALKNVGASAKAVLKIHSFELDQDAQRLENVDYADLLARKYDKPREDAQRIVDNMTAMARGAGLEYRFDHIVPCSSFKAHRLTHLATAQGLEFDLAEALFSAYLCESKDISDDETLRDLAESVGLDGELVVKVLDEGTYAHDVREDERRASRMGIHSVPFFLIDGKFGISGAQSTEFFQEVLEKVLAGTLG